MRRLIFIGPALFLLCLAVAISGQAQSQSGPLTVLSREGRRPLATVELQGHRMVGLDDLADLFQLQIREDTAARAVTAAYKNQTLVLTPDQSLVSASGRLVSLPAPLTRQGRRWLVPIEFISRALAPIYDTRLELRPESRLVIVGDLRVPRVTAQYDAGPNALRVTLEMTPRANAVVTQEPGRLLVRIDADSLDASLPAPSPQGLLAAIRASEPNTIQMDLGPRFSAFRALPPVSSGAASVLTIELLAAADSSSAASTSAPGASASAPGGATADKTADKANAPVAPGASTSAPFGATADKPGPLPTFTAASRPTIGTIVIDPGHGGDDLGVKGPGGSLEKNVTLSTARRVKAVIESRLGIRVLLTHEDHTIDDDRRAAIANNNKADLFISLHANGSPRPSARGATIFTLTLDRFGEDARRQSQADREVLPVFGGRAREIALVEWALAQAAHLDGSNAFAGIVDQRLRSAAGLPAVALQRAPMRNLAGANMPAVLIEMGYLSNPDEEKLLTSNTFQSTIATVLTDAVVAFRDYLEQAPLTPTESPAPVPPKASAQ